MTYNVFGGTLSLTQSINHLMFARLNISDKTDKLLWIIANYFEVHFIQTRWRDFCPAVMSQRDVWSRSRVSQRRSRKVRRTRRKWRRRRDQDMRKSVIIIISSSSSRTRTSQRHWHRHSLKNMSPQSHLLYRRSSQKHRYLRYSLLHYRVAQKKNCTKFNAPLFCNRLQ